MIRPTKFAARDTDDLTAIMRLYDTKDGKALCDAINSQVQKFDVEARAESDPVRARWLQGASQALASLSSVMENSRQLLKTLEDNIKNTSRMNEAFQRAGPIGTLRQP